MTSSLLALGALAVGVAVWLVARTHGRRPVVRGTMDPGVVAEVRAAHLHTIERLRDVERRARAEWSSPTAPRSLLLAPVRAHSAWALACALARSPDSVAYEGALRAIHAELARRGKSHGDLEEMTAMVRWAIDVINPVNGRTRESGGTVHQLVADRDDLDLAISVAAERGATAQALEGKRALLRRHDD